MAERIIIVDEEDNIIGSKEREKKKPEDIFRVTSLWIENSKGDILLAQRSLTRKKSPGKWGPAVAGTVAQGETYDDNIIKEAAEEIGLSNVHLEKKEKVRMKGSSNFFGQRYEAKLDLPIEAFTIQEEEVAAIRWFTRKELKKLIKEKPEQFISIVVEKMRG